MSVTRDREINDQLEKQGFFVARRLIDPSEILSIRKALVGVRTSYKAGLRNIIEQVPGIQYLALSKALENRVVPVLGADAGLVRALYFDKSYTANWKVGWHQDRTIAVKQRRPVAGFTGWSIKAKVPHVQAPVELLENMLTCRIHLDPADQGNGALRILPCSHQLGVLDPSALVDRVKANGCITCSMEAGDVLLMRPLLAHASNKSTSTKPRRVIHLEYAGGRLPHPLQWWEKTGFLP